MADNSSALGSGSSAGGLPMLAVQCGPGAVLQLSFEELQALAGATRVADVADAPAEAVGLSTLTGAAAQGSGAASLTGPVSFRCSHALAHHPA